MADLLVDVKDQSLDQKTRNAAAISAKHFKELVALKESAPSDEDAPAVPKLTLHDIDFLTDMINHKTVKRGLSAAAEDLKAGFMWGGLGLGAVHFPVESDFCEQCIIVCHQPYEAIES